MSVVTGDYTLNIMAIPTNSEFEETLENNSETFKTHIRTSNPLPVEYINLEGRYDAFNRNAQLEWKTLSTDPINQYVIERSRDAQNFEQISQIKESRTSSSEMVSTLIDPLTLEESGIYYYRAKAEALDGSHALSNIVSIEHKSEVELKVFPVPARNSINLEINNLSHESVLINVHDALGRRVISNLKYTLSEGSSILALNIETLAPGNYTLDLVFGDQRATREFVVIK
jgi:hypothetical protein